MLQHAIGVVLVGTCLGAARAASEEVRIYPTSTLAPGQYQVVKRLWVESWRSAFFVPKYQDQAAAVTALKKEAVQNGANALTDVVCLTDDKPLIQRGRHFCYALAIRVKGER